MRDLPSAGDLVELGRRLLLDELAPLLPEAHRREVHLVATAIAMLQREAAAGEAPEREVLAMLRNFYGDAPRPAPLPACGEREAEQREAGGGDSKLDELLARFAADLRIGAFETSGSRQSAARAILWRLTILKLREANPHFLAANGLV